jgi:hypothetical protein
MCNFRPLIVVVLLLAGCASERVSLARLTKHEAVQIAVSFAQKSDRHVDDYRAPRADYDPKTRDWWIWFDEKTPQHAGGYMVISVDDVSGVCRFIPSR